ncbi:MAG: DNA-protecting protein DprA, partial [Armatimonadetes bacterium]|nr:DNA-protecting protein DprA [Armatimonadota bacterium]NIO74319.1 DNA-protecting protein DprA [Armatimonadota bacterium]NIO95526.1 DNA-protecting protein DprA [Armatimonadota bacterium]
MGNVESSDIPAWLALSRAELPPRLAVELLEHFHGPTGIFSASPVEIASATHLSPTMLSRLLSQRPDDIGVRDQAALQAAGISIITIQDFDYPPLLRQIPDPPPLLYVRGRLQEEDNRAVAVVGSRRCSPYGRLVAHSLARELALRGITVVSGLAVGIDGAAHQGAIEAGGRTIGVMACGLDVPYPRQHDELKEQIIKQGAVISEVPLGTSPTPPRFPVRNRIISGLSLGTVVVEAPERSGALITARLAAEQGREVFAVPGNVNSFHARGCHQLIRDGANLAEKVEDILQELHLPLVASPDSEIGRDTAGRPAVTSVSLSSDAGPAQQAASAEQAQPSPHPTGFPPEENRLLACLSLQQKYVDQIIRETSLPSSQVSAGLMMLELKGLVKRLPGNL